jgi:alkaline phosphatase D
MTATSRPPDDSVFTSAVASGDVTQHSVVLWTRVDATRGDPDAVLTWSVDDRAGHARSGTVEVTSANDHCVHVLVDDLAADTTYTFRFEHSGEEISGRTRTLPQRSDHLRFAVACCSRWGWPGFDLFDEIVAEHPAFLLHLGDAIYEIGETPPNGATTDPPHDCHTLDDYRRRHAQYRSDERLQRLLAAMPMIAVWDDHEVVDNAPDPDSQVRRRAGQRAWRDWMPTRWTGDDEPLDRRLSIDGLVDLALVDSRFEGRSANDIGGPGVADAAPGHILSERQWHDLEEFAARSSTPWFVLANQVQVSPMTLAARPAVAWPPWRRVVNPDQWDGYPDERARLASVVRRVAGRRVVLSGDLHSAWSRTWRHDGGTIAHEFTCPSISGETYGRAVQRTLPLPIPLTQRWLRLLNRGIDHLDLDTHGYLVCDVSPERFSTTIVTSATRHTVELS